MDFSDKRWIQREKMRGETDERREKNIEGE